MSHNDEVQRSVEWFQQRAGIPTASRFADLMTNPQSKADKEAGNLSTTALSYAFELIAQKLTGEYKNFSSAATDHGNYFEPVAIEAYTERTGNDVLECGFVRHKTIATGASPDGLIGIDGALEVKCPFNSVNHIRNAYTKEVPKEYLAQVQGQIWVLNVEWVDFVSFDPRIESESGLSIVRVFRDDKFINELESKVIKFNDKLEEIFNKLTKVEF